MIENAHNLTLDRKATYQIKAPGALDENWLSWNGGVTISIESDSAGTPISTINIRADQAALHGLLHRLYSLGLPLISVVWIERGAT